ncbi:MAG: C-GCAxxG-C-C family protein [Candidatus Ranarchaeia archaeon]|jgi:C_GCAxxG_C_C family probable redox protein
MKRVEEAVKTFQQGFTCAQAVLSAFGLDYGLSRNLALKIGTPFGAGFARRGDTCGAVTGAMMVIGLEYGRTRIEDEEAKLKTYKKTQEFLQRFEDRHGSIDCRDLLGYDVSKPEELAVVAKEGLCDELCPEFVRVAAEILKNIIE